MSYLLNISNDIRSYQQLIDMYEQHKGKLFENIEIELKQFFCANLSAPFGGLLDLLIKNNNKIEFKFANDGIKEILQKNNFLTYYGEKKIDDYNSTTIVYQKLTVTDGKFFKEYIFKELLGRGQFSFIDKTVKDNIAISLSEIFNNSQIHSKTSNIYMCGQYFPKQDKICFTIADTGIGFKNSVNRSFDSKLDAQQSLKWAVQEGKTAKQGISGGIGLAVLKEFISQHNGVMEIISDSGYYKFSQGKEELSSFNGSYPGAFVNLTFSTIGLIRISKEEV